MFDIDLELHTPRPKETELCLKIFVASIIDTLSELPMNDVTAIEY